MSDVSTIPCIAIDELVQLQAKPAVYEPGESHFWTDPHIASQMLKAHLDPNSDAASRRPETIRRSVDWLVQTMGLKPGDSLIDLGCGPGLYTSLLVQHGLQVTGVDFSENSIRYAMEEAQQKGLAVAYRCQNYLQLNDQSCYDVVTLIYGDYCPLSPQERSTLLANVHKALKPGGHFVLDVSTPLVHQRYGLKNGWYAAGKGFWKPGPHLVLEQGFAYDGDIYLDQYVVLEENGKISVYRNWFQDFTAETIRAELEANGFIVESIWGDLTGAPYDPSGDWIGVVAHR